MDANFFIGFLAGGITILGIASIIGLAIIREQSSASEAHWRWQVEEANQQGRTEAETRAWQAAAAQQERAWEPTDADRAQWEAARQQAEAWYRRKAEK